MARLILVSGSMAAGKGTVSALVVERLRARGLSVASTALDDVADMARPTLPDWEWAHDIHARLVGLWASTGMDVVVDEGASSRDEVQAILRELPPDVPVLHVTLVGEYHRALQRAQDDPTRGISKDPGFLRAQYGHFATQLPLLDADLVLYVGNRTPDELVNVMVREFERRKSYWADSAELIQPRSAGSENGTRVNRPISAITPPPASTRVNT